MGLKEGECGGGRGHLQKPLQPAALLLGQCQTPGPICGLNSHCAKQNVLEKVKRPNLALKYQALSNLSFSSMTLTHALHAHIFLIPDKRVIILALQYQSLARALLSRGAQKLYL